ncbi:GNAT family N-acetyltransferase [Pedobacter caeni]|uniref:Protein N-acetyltransferase, RimJ/RimL family n=1 Tax=Pedobacter caeni TaxID=288992 RepID=A0A1M5BM01_9SPHI|nr:GNAT family protein [Pedobacter caeni]SHF43529.1 Protein N-acetyltransferase, RimJ/RimL family [Pedobacter caeni]
MPGIINICEERLIIRDLNETDLLFVHGLHSIAEVQQYATMDLPESIADSADYLNIYIEQQNISPRKEYGFCITLADQTRVGLIGLSNHSRKFQNAELWFKLSPEYWGKGYAAEAISALFKFGFKQLLLHRIEAGVSTENKPSIRVLEKTGMKREGLRRKILPIRGEWKDNYHYAILEEEFHV